ncbi:MAG: hypothetical protein EPO35_09260 [Acidobacteria bacterium]|nr:MAG: hypothetical protein EPO35_09260 [Acidobacteriota bacterium]
MPRDYSQPFELEGPVGNNAFSFGRRGPRPSLWVPSLIEGSLDDVRPGERVVFEDVDEHGVLHACTGLAHLVRTTWRGVPTIIVDNHNHAFYFWCEALLSGGIQPGAALVHVDQHRDTRIPELGYSGRTIEDAFEYTNFRLNVGNYVVPAERAGIIGECQFVTGAEALDDVSLVSRRNKILNIDLDYFAPEMAHVDFAKASRFIAAHLPAASLVTIATSPFFIEQKKAIEALRELTAGGPFLA